MRWLFILHSTAIADYERSYNEKYCFSLFDGGFCGGAASAGVKKIAVLDFEDASIVSTDFESNPVAAKLGRLLGVSGIIVGSVTEFNTKTETRGVFGVGTKVKTATVAVNARLIDTTSGEVVFAAEGKGSEEETNVSVGSFYGSNTTGASEALLSGATRKAAAEIIQTLKANSARIKDQVIEGVVVNVDPTDKSVMIDVGSEVGVALNQTMYAIKVTKEIKNRQGEVIKRLTSVVGEFKVKEVEKKVATLSCVAGNCPSVKEGDRIESNK